MWRRLLHTAMQETLSGRAQDMLQKGTFIGPYFSLVRNNRYHPLDNPKGIADLGLAENKLCDDLWEEKIKSVAQEPEGHHLLHYEKASGNIEFKKTLKTFIESRFQAKEELNIDSIFVTNGVTVVLEALSIALADPGDHIMVTTPYYYRIRNDVYERPSVNVLEVPLGCDINSRTLGQSFVNDIEAVYQSAVDEGKLVKAVMIINPDNPTGGVLTESQLTDVLQFAHRHQLHVIANEIYGLSVFHPDVKFTSILSLVHPDPDKVHFTWGVSKDFGLSGYRCGVFYTKNEALTKYFGLTSIYFRAAGLIQHRLKSILDDTEWLDKTFFPTMKKRKSERFQQYKSVLEAHAVQVYPSPATIFIWANFSEYLPEKSFEAEKLLFDKFLESRVFLLPGQSFYAKEPGWFRVVSSLDEEVHNEGLQRIISVLRSIQKS
ncbi:unnamed protein product [Lymnaea stagnalis]|uniref:Aminotransferase class I/classII large domain-containing protein n=1 Tax=Lymnaea stagnalis TaxID=6523 RepID=A0AAV2HJ35_LYMST